MKLNIVTAVTTESSTEDQIREIKKAMFAMSLAGFTTSREYNISKKVFDSFNLAIDTIVDKKNIVSQKRAQSTNLYRVSFAYVGEIRDYFEVSPELNIRQYNFKPYSTVEPPNGKKITLNIIDENATEAKDIYNSFGSVGSIGIIRVDSKGGYLGHTLRKHVYRKDFETIIDSQVTLGTEFLSFRPDADENQNLFVDNKVEVLVALGSKIIVHLSPNSFIFQLDKTKVKRFFKTNDDGKILISNRKGLLEDCSEVAFEIFGKTDLTHIQVDKNQFIYPQEDTGAIIYPMQTCNKNTRSLRIKTHPKSLCDIAEINLRLNALDYTLVLFVETGRSSRERLYADVHLRYDMSGHTAIVVPEDESKDTVGVLEFLQQFYTETNIDTQREMLERFQKKLKGSKGLMTGYDDVSKWFLDISNGGNGDAVQENLQNQIITNTELITRLELFIANTTISGSQIPSVKLGKWPHRKKDPSKNIIFRCEQDNRVVMFKNLQDRKIAVATIVEKIQKRSLIMVHTVEIREKVKGNHITLRPEKRVRRKKKGLGDLSW